MSEVTSAQVDRLTASVEALAKRLARQRMLARVLAVVSAVTLVMGILLYDTQVTLGGAIAKQDVTTNQVLCPLYGVFIYSIKHPSESQKQQIREATPAQRKARESAVRVVMDGYESLDCK